MQPLWNVLFVPRLRKSIDHWWRSDADWRWCNRKSRCRRLPVVSEWTVSIWWLVPISCHEDGVPVSVCRGIFWSALRTRWNKVQTGYVWCWHWQPSFKGTKNSNTNNCNNVTWVIDYVTIMSCELSVLLGQRYVNCWLCYDNVMSIAMSRWYYVNC